VIKERVMVEKTVVVEQEKIKDTEAFAGAERQKKVAVTAAEQRTEEQLVEKVKTAQASKEAEQLKADELYYHEVRKAESSKKATELQAEETVISAEAHETAAGREAAAKKTLAEGTTAEAAATGLGEATVLEAKAAAYQKQGEAEATVSESKYLADAKGISEKGAAEASANEKKYAAEAQGINQKAEAMKLFNEAGKEHEEFKLRLQKDKEIELAEIEINEKIAEHQAKVLAEALKNTKVDIVGGSTDFYDRIVGSVTRGKSIDRMLDHSHTLTDVKETFFNGNSDYFKNKLKEWTEQFNISTEDIKNLSIAALLHRIGDQADDDTKKEITDLQSLAEKYGISGKKAGEFFDQLIRN